MSIYCVFMYPNLRPLRVFTMGKVVSSPNPRGVLFDVALNTHQLRRGVRTFYVFRLWYAFMVA